MSTNPPRKRASAPQMKIRRIRIMGWLQAGMSYDEIAGHEDLSRERVRQIVVEALKQADEDRSLDRRALNEVRLAPALRLAAKAVFEGKLEGVDRLIKVIDRLEKLQGKAPPRVYDEGSRARLLDKLNKAAARLKVFPAQESENMPETATSL
jgi:hypothetical protein